MQNEFREKIAAIRAKGEEIYSSCSDIKTITQEALNELSAYETSIPEFFSYKNEAVKIKELYKKLKGLDYARNRVISCVDMGCACYLYKEYLSGMYTFLDRFFKEVSVKGDNISLMEKQLNTAIHGDPLFIDTLFGGSNNEPSEQVLTDAIGNVEYLVDFLDHLKSMKQMVSDVCNIASELEPYEYTIRAVKLIVNSTCVFSSLILTGIMDIYVAIQNKIDDNYEKPLPDTSFRVF